MNELAEFSFNEAMGLPGLTWSAFLVMLLRLSVATILGASVAYRPWRRLIRHATLIPRETAQAQTLISVAGALMVAVIGDSMARAFGLVGLGAFIRFRSGIKDPRDAAVMFVMIGIGMACGLGAPFIALVATVFVGAVLVMFDMSGKGRVKLTRVALQLESPHLALPAVVAALPGARIMELPDPSAPVGKLAMDLELPEEVDAAFLMDKLQRAQVTGVRSVVLDTGKNNV